MGATYNITSVHSVLRCCVILLIIFYAYHCHGIAYMFLNGNRKMNVTEIPETPSSIYYMYIQKLDSTTSVFLPSWGLSSSLDV